MPRPRLRAVVLVVAFLSSMAPSGAGAQPAPGVTLHATKDVLVFGDKTHLWGAIDPASPSQTVNIVDESTTVIATATTDDDGHYSLDLAPRKNVRIRAQWTAAVSDDVPLKVKSRLHVSLGRIRVFGHGTMRGTVLPARSGAHVTFSLKRRGKVEAKGRAPLEHGRWFKQRVAIPRPGAYRVVVHFDDPDHAPTTKISRRRKTKLPRLGVGSRGPMVGVLEKRLADLGYHLEGVDRRYDYRTSDAVIAFNKVQGRTRSGSVDASTWRAFASPIVPRPRVTKPTFHIEVDQTKQLLFMVKKGKVRGILHVSTGANGYTHDGLYHVYRKVAGYSPHRLYYPSYFDGARALHGWPEVPTYNASHGCVRLPMWSAQWVYGKADVGTEVLVYH